MLEIFNLLSFCQEIMKNFKLVGIVIGTFLSSSIFPLPSEAVLVSAGLLGISPILIAIFGGIGSSLGSIVGYWLGKGSNSFLKKYGRYFLIDPKNLRFAESWFKRWGNLSILIGRIIPFIPYKIFSVGCGFGRINFKNFFVFTLIGSIPRCFLLSYFGFLIALTRNVYLTLASFLAFLILPSLIEKSLKK